MKEYQMDMLFFHHACRVSLVIAAAALAVAVILYFVFDIRTIFLIRTGLAKRRALLTDLCEEEEEVRDLRFRIVKRMIITDSKEMQMPDQGK